MKRKAFKKVLAVVLVGAMAAGITVSASAAEGYFDAPTSEMEVDPSYGTAAVHRAASVLPEILGLSTVSGFSTINGGMPTTLEAAQSTLMLGAFGTNMNDNPDPFYYNLFYNFWAAENGAELSQHAMLNDNNVSASPGGADTTIIDGYGTSISLAGRPDMLIGCSGNGDDISGYDALIEDIRSGAIGEQYYQEGDENYNPYLCAYTFTYTYDMVVVANTVAHIMDERMATLDGKYGRYSVEVLGENGKSAVQIAQDLGDYVNGISLYVLEEIANNPLVDKKTSAVISSIDATGGTITLANSDSQSATSNNRIAEYCEMVTDNIANTELGTSVSVAEMMDNADALVFSGSNYNTLLDAVQQYDSDYGTNYEDQLDDKVIIQNYPNSVYGITMNSIENTMGFGYFVGYLYCDVLPEINPVYMTAYFYQNFYHISDLKNVQSVLNVTCQSVVLPENVTTDLDNYDEDAIYNDLQTGKDYYYANFNDFSETALTEVWQKDRDAGIYLPEGTWKHFDPTQELLDEIASVQEWMAGEDQDDYTTGSWAALEEALATAEAISKQESATESECYDALLALEDAQDALVYVGDLKDAIADAGDLNEDEYTASSWAALDAAVADAQALIDEGTASQDEIDDAQDAIEDAIDALEQAATPEEKADLQDEINAAGTLNEDDYTASSWAALQDAIEAAQAVVDSDDVTSEDVKAAQEALEDAVDSLVEAATPEEKAELQSAIDDAAAIEQGDYTDESYNALQEAIIDAQEAVDDADATSEDIADAAAELQAAIDGLEEKATPADKEELQNAVDEANALNKDDYTEDSWAALQSALDDVQAVLDNEDASQEDVEAALEEVKTAVDNLEPATPTPTPTPTPIGTGVKKVDGVWGYYVDSVLQTSYTGVAPMSNENGWWYINNGLVDFSKNSVEKNQNGWWLVEGGKVNFNYTGVANYKNANGWWYVNGGKVDFSKNSVEKNKNGWWLVEGGKVNFNYTGVANYKNANGWWYVNGGKVDFNKNSVEKNKNGWWLVEGGKVNFNYTGVANYKNSNGWWYVKGGKVDFTFNGRASNKNGTWNVRNGKVVF